jgi:multiple sugar transport system permease protein/raffinose/stachyose/melibiose transport system permease protein
MRRTRRRIGRALTFLILCVVVVVMLFPFLFMVLTAFKSKDQYVSGTGFSLDGWAELFKFLPVVQELVNSAVVTAGAVLLIIAVSTTGGFAFAKLGFRGAGVVFLGILAGMMIPMQSIIIPEFVNIARVAHLNNQYLGAILVYAALGAPIATYLMTTYYRGIPSELVEASVMDGASYWQVFRKVMLPLSIPAITTIAVGLAVIQTGRVVNVPALMAGSLLSALPAIVVYLIFQRNLIQGLTMGVNK